MNQPNTPLPPAGTVQERSGGGSEGSGVREGGTEALRAVETLGRFGISNLVTSHASGHYDGDGCTFPTSGHFVTHPMCANCDGSGVVVSTGRWTSGEGRTCHTCDGLGYLRTEVAS